MPKGFPRGCPLPDNLKMLMLRDSGSRRGRGTCSTCKHRGQVTQAYRDKPCPHMKWVGKYIKPII